jgi:hypothetical protein
VKLIIKSGTFEHQQCILLSVLSDPAICNVASSIGVNIHDIHLGQQLLTSAKKLLKHATNTNNKNPCVGKLQRNVIQTIGVALMPTPTKDGNWNHSNRKKKQNEISIPQLSKQLGLSNGLGWRALIQGMKRCKAIAECNANGWIMINDNNKRAKYSDELLDDLESWIQDNGMIRFNPSKNKTIIKQDRDGGIVRDMVTLKPISVPKFFMTCNPRELHNHMIVDFDWAMDGDQVLISESKIQQILNTSCCHIKMMSDRQKMMCGCETCIIFEDIQRCVNMFRKRYIALLKKDINKMPNVLTSVNATNDLQQYIQSVCNNQLGEVLKYESGWEATYLLGCPHVAIGGRTYTQMRCALKLCPNCVDKWKDVVPKIELNCSERISYVVFGTHSKCSYHGNTDMQVEGKEHICRACETMSDEKSVNSNVALQK